MDLAAVLSKVTSLDDRRKQELIKRFIKEELTDDDTNDLVYHLTLASVTLKQEKSAAEDLLLALNK